MVAKPALIRQGDVTRILKGAKAAGITMSVTVVGSEVRFVPVEAGQQTASKRKAAKDFTLQEWIAKDRARQAKAKQGQS